jgi:hypothetical protein
VHADGTAPEDVGVGVGSHSHADADAVADAELKEFEANMEEGSMDDINSFLPPAPEEGDETLAGAAAAAAAAGAGDDDVDGDDNGTDADADGPPRLRENRLLNPVELLSLVRMTFPKSEATVDESGRFVVRGLERRDAVERGASAGRVVRAADMFPFALTAQPSPSDPASPFTALLKRKLALLAPEPAEDAEGQVDAPPPKRRATIGVNIPPAPAPTHMHMQAQAQAQTHATLAAHEEDLAPEERELLDGLARFRHSRLGREARDVCVQQ